MSCYNTAPGIMWKGRCGPFGTMIDVICEWLSSFIEASTVQYIAGQNRAAHMYLINLWILICSKALAPQGCVFIITLLLLCKPNGNNGV